MRAGPVTLIGLGAVALTVLPILASATEPQAAGGGGAQPPSQTNNIAGSGSTEPGKTFLIFVSGPNGRGRSDASTSGPAVDAGLATSQDEDTSGGIRHRSFAIVDRTQLGPSDDNARSGGSQGSAGTGKYLTMRPRPADQANITDGTSNTLMLGEKAPTTAGGAGDTSYGTGVYKGTDSQGQPAFEGGMFNGKGTYHKGAVTGKTSTLGSLGAVGSVNDLFGNSRVGDQGPQLKNAAGDSRLQAMQKVPIQNVLGSQPTANNGTPPPPPPPPPTRPTASPLPVLIVIADQNYAPKGDKALSGPIGSSAGPSLQTKAPTLNGQVGAGQSITIGGARTR